MGFSHTHPDRTTSSAQLSLLTPFALQQFRSSRPPRAQEGGTWNLTLEEKKEENFQTHVSQLTT